MPSPSSPQFQDNDLESMESEEGPRKRTGGPSFAMRITSGAVAGVDKRALVLAGLATAVLVLLAAGVQKNK